MGERDEECREKIVVRRKIQKENKTKIKIKRKGLLFLIIIITNNYNKIDVMATRFHVRPANYFLEEWNPNALIAEVIISLISLIIANHAIITVSNARRLKLNAQLVIILKPTVLMTLPPNVLASHITSMMALLFARSAQTGARIVSLHRSIATSVQEIIGKWTALALLLITMMGRVKIALNVLSLVLNVMQSGAFLA